MKNYTLGDAEAYKLLRSQDGLDANWLLSKKNNLSVNYKAWRLRPTVPFNPDWCFHRGTVVYLAT